MAIDTEANRSSAVLPCCPWRGLLPPVDGSVSQNDRQHLAGLYGGIAASSPVPEITDAVFKQCLDAIQTQIKTLGLSGVSNDNIVVKKLPWDHNVSKPGVFIHPIRETLRQATNASDDVGYGIQVVMVQAANQDLTSNFNRILMWRQQISRHFRYQRLPGVSEVHQCIVIPQDVISPGAFANQFDVSVLLIRCMCDEPRG